MTSLLNRTSAADLASTLGCAQANHRAFPLEQLQRSLADELAGVGPRKTIINLLQREIKRQEAAQCPD